MFFEEHSHLPHVKFSLHLLALDPIVDTFSININGQKLTESKSKNNSYEFKWPSQSDAPTTTLQIKNIEGKTFELSELGYWGWLKVLNSATIKAYKNDSKNYQLIFDINGNAAKFLLSANRTLNPFIPGILQHFTLPKQLA